LALKIEKVIRFAALVLVIAVLSGCAAQRAYQRAERDMRKESWDRAVLGYSKAIALDPGNTRYAVALERAKLKASADHFTKGRRYADAGQLELAVAEFQQTLLLSPDNQHATSEMQRAMRELYRLQQGPSEIEQLKERARRKDLGPPKLDPRSNIPILLNFKEVEVGKIFAAISKASGINFIFDDKVDQDKPMTIDIGNVSLEKALDILMMQTKNFYKVIDEFTLLIAPDTRQKRQEYEDQVIRTFFLSNAETKTVVTLLRSLLQSRQIAENADLNSVTIKDTPPKVAIAERIINANDKSKGEVLIDVELLEINRTVAKTLGIDLSSKTLALSFRGSDEERTLPLNNLSVLKQSGNWTIGVVPSVILNFLKSDADTKAIAKPQLRVSEGERAEIMIGDRVPIPTTSFNTGNTIGTNVVPITSFTYQNVGITVQIEPRVHHNKEVTLTVQVEVSQISSFIDTAAGQSQPVIGTRQIQTVIRLRDGETNLLAGLIQRSRTDTMAGVAGVMDIPGLRRVMSNTSINNAETDIILTLTPRIIRIPDITEDDLATLWVGTEENMHLRGAARSEMNQGPFAGGSVDDDLGMAGDEDAALEPTRRGSVSSIAPSDEVQRDRADAEERALEEARRREREEEQEPEDAGIQEDFPPEDEPADVAEQEPAGDQADTDAGGTKDDAADTPTGTVVIQMVPSKSVYTVGEPVVVQIVVDNAHNVGSTPFHLRYNKEVLQYIPPGAEGPFMKSDGANTVFLATDIAGGGEVVVGLSRLGAGEGAYGSGILATFQFQAINPGECGFAFTGASVKDPQARNLPAAFNIVPVSVE
jgi:general secretion pathway protein D